jgi:8-oxo-dGTP diphosphatase
MTPLDGRFVPGQEVDEAPWLPWDEASRVLTYDRDRSVLESADLKRGLPDA